MTTYHHLEKIRNNGNSNNGFVNFTFHERKHKREETVNRKAEPVYKQGLTAIITYNNLTDAKNPTEIVIALPIEGVFSKNTHKLNEIRFLNFRADLINYQDVNNVFVKNFRPFPKDVVLKTAASVIASTDDVIGTDDIYLITNTDVIENAKLVNGTTTEYLHTVVTAMINALKVYAMSVNLANVNVLEKDDDVDSDAYFANLLENSLAEQNAK